VFVCLTEVMTPAMTMIIMIMTMMIMITTRAGAEERQIMTPSQAQAGTSEDEGGSKAEIDSSIEELRQEQKIWTISGFYRLYRSCITAILYAWCCALCLVLRCSDVLFVNYASAALSCAYC
jgi:hypothetical protein